MGDFERYIYQHPTPLADLKDRLPVSYLLFTSRGRIDRVTYWTASLFIWSTFYILFKIAP
jgi:hypothetical protein